MCGKWRFNPKKVFLLFFFFNNLIHAAYKQISDKGIYAKSTLDVQLKTATDLTSRRCDLNCKRKKSMQLHADGGVLRTWKKNKANLRNLIAATGLVILLKLDSNHRFTSPCDLEIWWMNNRAPLLYYSKRFASFRSHWWIQTGVTVRKRLIWVKINGFFCAVWPWNLTDGLQTSYMLLRAAFRSHWWIQTGVTVRKRPIWVKIDDFFSRDLQTWQMTFKTHRAPILCHFKLCASFRAHWWIKTGVTARKRLILGRNQCFFEPCDLQTWRMTLKNHRAPLFLIH